MEWHKLITKGTPPEGRVEHTMIHIHYLSSIAIYGGRYYNNKIFKYLNDLHILNLKNLNWITVELLGYDKPVRGRHCACEYKS